jgi:hypothetical protein
VTNTPTITNTLTNTPTFTPVSTTFVPYTGAATGVNLNNQNLTNVNAFGANGAATIAGAVTLGSSLGIAGSGDSYGNFTAHTSLSVLGNTTGLGYGAFNNYLVGASNAPGVSGVNLFNQQWLNGIYIGTPTPTWTGTLTPTNTPTGTLTPSATPTYTNTPVTVLGNQSQAWYGPLGPPTPLGTYTPVNTPTPFNGAASFSSLTVSGASTLTGATTIGSTLGVAGTLNAAGAVTSLNLTTGAVTDSSENVSGAVTSLNVTTGPVTGTSGVFSGLLSAVGGYFKSGAVTATSFAVGATPTPGATVVANNQSMTINGGIVTGVGPTNTPGSVTFTGPNFLVNCNQSAASVDPTIVVSAGGAATFTAAGTPWPSLMQTPGNYFAMGELTPVAGGTAPNSIPISVVAVNSANNVTAILPLVTPGGLICLTIHPNIISIESINSFNISKLNSIGSSTAALANFVPVTWVNPQLLNYVLQAGGVTVNGGPNAQSSTNAAVSFYGQPGTAVNPINFWISGIGIQ